MFNNGWNSKCSITKRRGLQADILYIKQMPFLIAFVAKVILAFGRASKYQKLYVNKLATYYLK